MRYAVVQTEKKQTGENKGKIRKKSKERKDLVTRYYYNHCTKKGWNDVVYVFPGYLLLHDEQHTLSTHVSKHTDTQTHKHHAIP